MKTTFVNLKSELTAAKQANELKGFDCYRTRLKCNCQREFNHRYGIIVIDLTGHVLEHVIKCKSCASASVRLSAHAEGSATAKGGKQW